MASSSPPILDDVTYPVRRHAWQKEQHRLYEASRCLRIPLFSRFIPARASLNP